MSHTESAREDLMRDATALRIRGEFRVPDMPATVVAGCRENGGWSLYFGQDPCYHFNSRGELRRAFVRDRLYRTQGETLAEMRRVRSDASTHLMRRDLESPERDAFLNDMRVRIERLRETLQAGTATLIQSVPESADIAAALTRFLVDLADAPPALAPPIKTRRQ